MKSTRRRREAGLTLIELLVAVTLLALLIVPLFRLVGLGRTIEQRGGATLEAVDEAAVAQATIRRYLRRTRSIFTDASLLPRDDLDYFGIDLVEGGRNQQRLAFLGGPERLSFVTTMPSHLGGALWWLRLTVDEGDLVLFAQPLSSFAATRLGAPPPVERFVLARGMERIRISYRARSEELLIDEEPWRAFWDDAATMPALVRVDFGEEGDRGGSDGGIPAGDWPPIIVAIVLE